MDVNQDKSSLPAITIKDDVEVSTKNDLGYGAIEKETVEEVQMRKFDNSKSWRRWCRIEPLMVMLYIATSSIAISYPQLLYDMIAEDMGYTSQDKDNDTGECVEDDAQAASLNVRGKRAAAPSYLTNNEVTESDVQSEVNMWNIFILGSAMLPGVFVIVALSSWSDKVGRKKAMVPALIGCTIRTLIYLFLALFDWPMWTWIIAGLSEGITGGTFTVLSVGFAYVIDVTSLENRSRNILILELCTGLGSILAYVGTGYMIDAWGYGAPIGACLVIYVLSLLYTLFLLPESKTVLQEAKLFSLEHYKQAVRIFRPSITPRKTRVAIYGGLLILFLAALSSSGGEGMLNFYMLNYPICWDPVTISLYKTSDYLIQAIGAIIFMRLFYKRVGEIGLIIISCFSGAAMYQYLAFSYTTAMIFTSSIFGCAGRIAQPMSRALVSKYVSRDQQGSLMSLGSLCSLVPIFLANLIFNSIYSATFHWWRGLGFTCVAFFYMFPVTLAVLFIFGRRKGVINQTYEDMTNTPPKNEMTKF